MTTQPDTDGQIAPVCEAEWSCTRTSGPAWQPQDQTEMQALVSYGRPSHKTPEMGLKNKSPNMADIGHTDHDTSFFTIIF